MEKLELYIHIPFCMKKCDYCDFLSAVADEESQSAYMEALNREIAYYGNKSEGRRVSTIYIGGGTPSWLQEFYIERMMQQVRRSFRIEPDAEISMECNPGTLTRQKFITYKRAGINRLSIGLQSADNAELQLLGRIHTYEQFVRNYELARECGFDHINIDLMCGLPGQTVERFHDTLSKVVRLRPEHISAYSLIIEKGTPFYETYKFDVVKQHAGMQPDMLPNEDVEYQLGKMAQEYLAEHGYDRYEISNYARDGKVCRHNIGYWERVDYLGLGLGASSLLDNCRYRNVTELEVYISEAAQIHEVLLTDDSAETNVPGTNLHMEGMRLSRQAQMEEFLFLGLRIAEGIEKSRFYQAFGYTLDHIYGDVIRELSQEDLIKETTTRLFLTEKGADLSNYVLSRFLF